MNGAEALLASLKQEGVDVLFGISGGAILPIYDALGKQQDIWSILTRHEQGAGHMAEGYARATGRVGCCIGTSGPGATNLVTAITDAYMDSTPVVFLSGQVASPNIGKDAFQECDMYGITMPIVKHSYMVKRTADIPRIVKEAFHIARTGRPGPVLIDIPKDMGENEFGEFLYPESVNLRGYDPEMPAATEQIAAAAKLIAEAKQPVLYVGNGINSSDASDALLAFAEKIDAPVTTTLLGRGGFPSGHRLALDMLGMHGTAYANWAIHHADLIIALGARFDDRVTGNPKKWAPDAKIIHVDIDQAELGKIRFAQVPILGDVKTVIRQLAEATQPKKHTQWVEQLAQWKKDAPLTYEKTGTLKPQHVIEEIGKATAGEAIMTTDVGQHQMWAAQYYNPKNTRSFITSGGLGTMGYGYPAALGAKVGCIDKEVWCVTGDGSFQMNIQELATGVIYDIPVKIAVLNNSSLGMVRQWQKMFYERRWSGIDLTKCPDFEKIAQAYSATGVTVTHQDEVADAIREAQKNPGTVVLNFLTDKEEDVFPMIPGGKTIHDMVLDKSHKTVALPGINGAPSVEAAQDALETAAESEYASEWTDDLKAGQIRG
ncbi:MAG TPA: biosynthetic-type acetolactate synthase large subunit [Abditibacteriaceae bacterium]